MIIKIKRFVVNPRRELTESTKLTYQRNKEQRNW